MVRRLMYLLPWVVIVWIEVPAVVPESVAESGRGYYFAYAIRLACVVAAAVAAFKLGGGRKKQAWTSLALAVATLGGWVIAFLAGTIFPRTAFDGCFEGPLARTDVCHRWILGFSPDIPYYRLAKGPLDPSFCASFKPDNAWTESGMLVVLQETHELKHLECPSAVSGRCYAASWQTANGSDYWVAVAADDGCTRAVYFDGRGRPARERWHRLRGI